MIPIAHNVKEIELINQHAFAQIIHMKIIFHFSVPVVIINALHAKIQALHAFLVEGIELIHLHAIAMLGIMMMVYLIIVHYVILDVLLAFH